MADYKRLYYSLFNQITQATEYLEQTRRNPEAVQVLKRIQQEAEERFLDDEEESGEFDCLQKSDEPLTNIIPFRRGTRLSN
ncbi:hypothetical protein SDC9_58813 [bioreactor metagenome]|uniref:Uncharacterized protein n=1 Tax=bioreactor metagenome TaxID=1076179 RepID=A0A644X8G3_9ZZZZ